MTRDRTRRVVFQPDTARGMQRGINQMVEAIRPTLGPRARVVAMQQSGGRRRPELLDDGGTIARRIIELPDRDEDVGAMLVRHLLWTLRQRVGDGTAIAAVLFQSIYNQGVHYITSGGNSMQLRRHLEAGLQIIQEALVTQVRPVEGKQPLALIAESICYDLPLAKMLGEIFDIIGEYGRLELRSGRSQALEREYVEGMYWNSGFLSRSMITNHATRRAELEDAAILITDLEIEEPQQLVPVLQATMNSGQKALFIVARKLSESALALLLSNNQKPKQFYSVAVKIPGARAGEQAQVLEDLAILTGGRPCLKDAGDVLGQVQLEHLGRARRAWAEQEYFGIIGGRGNPRQLREHIARLRTSFAQARDPKDRQKIQERIGKLMGGSAVLWVGGATEPQIHVRKELAGRTAEVLRGAVREGVLPGGCVSLLSCQPPLRDRLDQSTASEERAAYRILLRALEEPMRTIIANAGQDASETMAYIKLAGPGHGYDVRSGEVADMAEAGIFDVAAVLRDAVGSAVTTAALALTIDVLVHHKHPKGDASRP